MDNLTRIFDFEKGYWSDLSADCAELDSYVIQRKIREQVCEIYECFSQALCDQIGSYSFKYNLFTCLRALVRFTLRVGVIPAQVLYEYEKGTDMMHCLYAQNLCDNNDEETFHRLVLDFIRDLGNICHTFRRMEGDLGEVKNNFLFYLRCTWNNLFAIIGLYFINVDELMDWYDK